MLIGYKIPSFTLAFMVRVLFFTRKMHLEIQINNISHIVHHLLQLMQSLTLEQTHVEANNISSTTKLTAPKACTCYSKTIPVCDVLPSQIFLINATFIRNKMSVVHTIVTHAIFQLFMWSWKYGESTRFLITHYLRLIIGCSVDFVMCKELELSTP